MRIQATDGPTEWGGGSRVLVITCSHSGGSLDVDVDVGLESKPKLWMRGRGYRREGECLSLKESEAFDAWMD